MFVCCLTVPLFLCLFLHRDSTRQFSLILPRIPFSECLVFSLYMFFILVVSLPFEPSFLGRKVLQWPSLTPRWVQHYICEMPWTSESLHSEKNNYDYSRIIHWPGLYEWRLICIYQKLHTFQNLDTTFSSLRSRLPWCFMVSPVQSVMNTNPFTWQNRTKALIHWYLHWSRG